MISPTGAKNLLRSYIRDRHNSQFRLRVSARYWAFKKLGRPLPESSEVHHVKQLKDEKALVICDSGDYHRLLHRRAIQLSRGLVVACLHHQPNHAIRCNVNWHTATGWPVVERQKDHP